MILKGVIELNIFLSFISEPIFIGLLLIYSFCITVYFILKKNKSSSTNAEVTFKVKTSKPLILVAISISFLAINTLFYSKSLISFLYFLLPIIFVLLLIEKSSKLILRKESLQSYKLSCTYNSIDYINFEPNSNNKNYNLNVTVNNKTYTIIIKTKDKHEIEEILNSKQL